ncbi:MAG: hypothetical protein AB199_02550 [Parcubacteria bacterium C7867-004]|nr:MAG: hypothetical protein AB199_02550 [Parcubacteria bacterium C7867-004]
METVRTGIYYHFKDPEKLYRVQGTAFHTETEETMVVYQPLYDDAVAPLCVRPLTMFLEDVDRPELGYKGPRFIFVRES